MPAFLFGGEGVPSQSYFVPVADFLYTHFSRLTLRGISTMVRRTAGETGRRASAEGATAPETLRHQGPQSGQTLWKAGLAASPKEQPALSREISQGKDRGGTHFPQLCGSLSCRL